MQAWIDSCYVGNDWQLLCKHRFTVDMQALVDSCYAIIDWQLLCKHWLTVVMQAPIDSCYAGTDWQLLIYCLFVMQALINWQLNFDATADC